MTNFVPLQRRNTDAADGDDSAMQPTIPRALDELYAYISNIQDPDNQGTFIWPVDSSVDSILEQENARLPTRTHGRALPLHRPGMLSLIQVEGNMSYTGCTPGADCQAKLLFSKENHQVIWSASIGDPFSTETVSVPFHQLDIKNLPVLSTSVIDSSHALSLTVNIKGVDSLTVNVASRFDSWEPIHVHLPLDKPYEPQDVFADPSSCPEVPIGILMELSPVLRNCINDGDGSSNAKREDLFDGSASGVSKVLLSIPLGALDAMNSKPFEPLWIICSVFCAPSSHETLRLTSQDHGEIFTDQSQKFVDRISVLDIAAKNQENDGYGSDPLVLESQHGSVCISSQG